MACAYPQIVLLGDSLLEQSSEVRDGFSFQGALQGCFVRKMDVINRGFSGWNTKNLLEYFDRIIPEKLKNSPKIEYLIVLIGANDASLPVDTNRQHVPIESYQENLNKIIHHPRILAHGPKILLVTPPPVNQLKLEEVDRADGHLSAIRSSAVSATYSNVARRVARENPDVTLIDLWQGIMDKAISMNPDHYTPGGPWLGSPDNGKAGGLDILLPDGLHMNGDAYRVFFELIIKHVHIVDQSIPEELAFPLWQVLSPPNLPATKEK